MTLTLTVLVAALMGAACRTDSRSAGQDAPSAPEAAAKDAAAVVEAPAESLARARAVARDLGRDLMGTLLEELQRGGPGQAVRVCAEVAQERTAAHAADGVAVRRVSRRVRNPADRPDPWESAVLARLAERHAAGDLPEEWHEVVQDGDSRRLRYIKPIVLAEPCLACHGMRESIDPSVRELLDERYPDDEAVGYAAGDLRGAVSVAIDLPADGG